MKALFDTNILIDYLNAVPQARMELAHYGERSISVITWMEVMIGVDRTVEAATRQFLDGFDLVGLDNIVAQRAVKLRQEHRMKLPDAIVWASAQAYGMLFVTRNIKDFPSADPAVRVPYQI